MKKTKNGLPVIAVVATICLVVGIVGMTACVDHKNEAESQARKWATSMGLDVKGVNCVNHDTDGDGYVSCTVSDANEKLHAIECTGKYTWNSGCRTPKLNLNRDSAE